jgi:hypothetical protein
MTMSLTILDIIVIFVAMFVIVEIRLSLNMDKIAKGLMKIFDINEKVQITLIQEVATKLLEEVDSVSDRVKVLEKNQKN